MGPQPMAESYLLEYSYPHDFRPLRLGDERRDIAFNHKPGHLGELVEYQDSYVDGIRFAFVTYKF